MKRIAASLASPALFIAAQVTAGLVVGVVQAVAILAVGAALGADVAIGASLAWLLPLAAVGSLIALNIGFIIAGLTGTPEGAASIASLLVMPLERAVEYLPEGCIYSNRPPDRRVSLTSFGLVWSYREGGSLLFQRCAMGCGIAREC